MRENFADAAQRHWRDAEILFAQQRMPNADHLYGFAAECSLKAVMKALGMPMLPDGRPQENKHRVHIDTLWRAFHTFATGPEAATYIATLNTDNPFKDWHVNQRYCSSDQVTESKVQPHRQGAEQAMKVLRQACTDGRLSPCAR